MDKALDVFKALALLLGLISVITIAVFGFTLILAVLPVAISWYVIYFILRYRRENRRPTNANQD